MHLNVSKLRFLAPFALVMGLVAIPTDGSAQSVATPTPGLGVATRTPTARPSATATPSVSQAPALIPREILFGNPEHARLRISPDGLRIAYLAPDPRGILQVWTRTIGQTDDRAITSDPKQDVFNYLWTYDSQRILYL